MKRISLLLLVLISVNVFGQVPSYVPSNGLIGWWPFNGNANDESGNGNDRTVNGAVLTPDRNGISNSSYSFNGSSDYLEGATNATLDVDNFTFSCWVSMNDTSGQQCIGGSYANPAGYHLRITNGKPTFRVHDGYLPAVGAREISSVSVLDPSRWYYLTFTCDQTQIMLYVNGLLEGSDTLGSFDFVNQSRLRIGCASWDFIEYFNGMIDDIGIWDRVLTQQEITNLYNGSLPPTCSGATLPASLSNGLVAWYPFCGNANDESGNGNNGVVSGSMLTSDRFGNLSSAYEFNGINNFITVNSSTSLTIDSTISISAWIRTSQPAGSIVEKGVAALYWNYGVATLDGYFGYTFTNYSVGPNHTVTDGNWHHVVCMIDEQADSIFFFIDGLKYASLFNQTNQTPFTGSVSNFIDPAGGAPLYLGYNGVSAFYDGAMDDVRIYNRLLSDSEIVDLYNESLCYQTITVTDTLIINAILTGFNPVAYQNSIKVYPNPSNDHITIDCGSNHSTLNGYSLRIDNLLSQTVYTTTITQQSYYVDLNTWTGNGVYLIYLINDQGTPIDVRKIVIQ